MKRIAFLFLSVVLVTQSLWASWVEISLRDLVKDNPVIVVGEIVEVKADARKSPDHNCDIAVIKVARVLKSRLKHKLGAKIELAMPAASRPQQYSTDIVYQKGAKGVWILEWRDGVFWATYPGDYQALQKEAEIKKYIAATSKGKASN